MQIYVRGARSCFHASGPEETMIRPWTLPVLEIDLSRPMILKVIEKLQ